MLVECWYRPKPSYTVRCITCATASRRHDPVTLGQQCRLANPRNTPGSPLVRRRYHEVSCSFRVPRICPSFLVVLGLGCECSQPDRQTQVRRNRCADHSFQSDSRHHPHIVVVIAWDACNLCTSLSLLAQWLAMQQYTLIPHIRQTCTVKMLESSAKPVCKKSKSYRADHSVHMLLELCFTLNRFHLHSEMVLLLRRHGRRLQRVFCAAK